MVKGHSPYCGLQVRIGRGTRADYSSQLCRSSHMVFGRSHTERQYLYQASLYGFTKCGSGARKQRAWLAILVATTAAQRKAPYRVESAPAILRVAAAKR